MNCEAARPLLEAFVDDDLDGAARAAVAAHVDGCAACHREARALLALAAAARETLGPIEPDRDLWPVIAGQVDNARRFEHRRGAHPARWLAAAALVVVAVGTVLVLSRHEAAETVAGPIAGPMAGPMAGPIAGPAAPPAVALAGWEREALANRTALLASLERQRDRLPAESIQAVEENLHLIDEAILEIRSALARDPDNRHLNFLLADAYQQEVQLLKRLDRV